MRTVKSARLFARALRILPGGVDSPVRAFKAVGGSPLFIRRAYRLAARRRRRQRAHRLRDVLGTAHPRARAARASSRRSRPPPGDGTSFGAPSALEVELGERVRRLMPSIERVRFVSSGTEATMSAVRVARAATKRDKIVKFEGCYHGHADAFLVKAGSGALTLGVPTSPGVTSGAAADTLLATLQRPRLGPRSSSRRTASRLPRSLSNRLPATWASCRQRTAFSAGCARSARPHGALLIFDEVITGFRVAAGGAQALFGVRPDLTCLGKIIGGGLPVGAYGGRADMMELVSPAGPVYQAGTLSGNPMAMTAGIWSLDRITPGLHRRLAALGRRLAAGLEEAARGAGVPLQVNVFGSVLTPFFTDRRVQDYESAASADTGRYARFFRAMIARGIYPPPSQFEAWFLSSAHTTKDVERTIAAAREAIQEAERS